MNAAKKVRHDANVFNRKRNGDEAALSDGWRPCLLVVWCRLVFVSVVLDPFVADILSSFMSTSGAFRRPMHTTAGVFLVYERHC